MFKWVVNFNSKVLYDQMAHDVNITALDDNDINCLLLLRLFRSIITRIGAVWQEY